MITWTRYGPNALLFRFADRVGSSAFARCRGIVTELESHPPSGLLEYVPAFVTILLEFDPAIVADPTRIAVALAAQLEHAAESAIPPGPLREIPICYDGEDLEALAQAKGMTPAEVCQRHSAPVYQVYLLGFAPGFPYLGELDPGLHTPRRATPRPRVRAGSVAIGGEHTGIYPRDSPGGWNIIGHTPAILFDAARRGPAGEDEGMFLLRPGDRVKFTPLQ